MKKYILDLESENGIDKAYMRMAIDLAKQAIGWTNPNPMVGAVIVKDGRVIGKGYHKKCGELHAERDAFTTLTESAEGATIYVTLEPCCHYGKQPPCTEAIVENKIARVVIGSRDPNPLVAGKGVKYLREHGIEVIEDFLKEACDEINPVFFHFITTGKPYVVMKYAMTMDGKIATAKGDSKWITGEKSRNNVQHERSSYAAILAGIGTVIADDPMLNVRLGEGYHQPVRVIVDSRLRISLDCQIVQTAHDYRTIVACSFASEEKRTQLEKAGVQVVELPPTENGFVDFEKLMEYLGSEKIDSVYVEGGGTIHETLIKTGLVNKVSAYIGPKIFGGKDAKTPVEGIGIWSVKDAPTLSLKNVTNFDDDLWLEYEVSTNKFDC